ncbi:MAG: fibronectin type III domain-containing protein, partial [Candidatus Diapherotrites archaeon]
MPSNKNWLGVRLSLFFFFLLVLIILIQPAILAFGPGSGGSGDDGSGDDGSSDGTPTPTPTSFQPGTEEPGGGSGDDGSSDGTPTPTPTSFQPGTEEPGGGSTPTPTVTPSPLQCVVGWKCLPGKENWRGYQASDCSWEKEEFCEGGCLAGVCLCKPVDCSAFSGKCGSFSNNCNGTIICGCNSGKNCVDGKCCSLVSCKAGECGAKSNECGQSIQCGSCETGFECNAFNQCVLVKKSLEILPGSVKVLPFSSYAVFYWQTSFESDSLVEYGTTASLGFSEFDGVKTSEHSIVVYGLTPKTKYFYRVVSSNGLLQSESEIF